MNKVWLIRTSKNEILGPVSKQKIKELLEQKSLKLDDELCEGNGYWFFVKEEDHIKKYLYQGHKQPFNPVSEAKDILTKDLKTEGVEIESIKEAKYQEPSSVVLQNNNEKFDIKGSRKKVLNEPSKDDNSSEDIKLPLDTDLEYPELELDRPVTEDSVVARQDLETGSDITHLLTPSKNKDLDQLIPKVKTKTNKEPKETKQSKKTDRPLIIKSKKKFRLEGDSYLKIILILLLLVLAGIYFAQNKSIESFLNKLSSNLSMNAFAQISPPRQNFFKDLLPPVVFEDRIVKLDVNLFGLRFSFENFPGSSYCENILILANLLAIKKPIFKDVKACESGKSFNSYRRIIDSIDISYAHSSKYETELYNAEELHELKKMDAKDPINLLLQAVIYARNENVERARKLLHELVSVDLLEIPLTDKSSFFYQLENEEFQERIVSFFLYLHRKLNHENDYHFFADRLLFLLPQEIGTKVQRRANLALNDLFLRRAARTKLWPRIYPQILLSSLVDKGYREEAQDLFFLAKDRADGIKAPLLNVYYPYLFQFPGFERSTFIKEIETWVKSDNAKLRFRAIYFLKDELIRKTMAEADVSLMPLFNIQRDFYRSQIKEMPDNIFFYLGLWNLGDRSF